MGEEEENKQTNKKSVAKKNTFRHMEVTLIFFLMLTINYENSYPTVSHANSQSLGQSNQTDPIIFAKGGGGGGGGRMFVFCLCARCLLSLAAR